MKRSGFKPRAQPMSRGTSTLKTTKPLTASKPMARGDTPMKARKAAKDKPKRAARENHAIRQSARGQDCTMQIPGVCNGDRETVVWAHSNDSSAGKGMGLKARDEEGCYACLKCHQTYDRQIPRPPGLTKEDIDIYFARGKHISRQILVRLGLLKDE